MNLHDFAASLNDVLAENAELRRENAMLQLECERHRQANFEAFQENNKFFVKTLNTILKPDFNPVTKT